MSDTRAVVLVGHCGPDMYMLKSAVSRIVPDARVATVNRLDALKPYVNSGSVLLINRVLDGSFEAGSGIELIRKLAQLDDPPVMMLISNFEDAQRDAVLAGARPGFGKSQLYNERTRVIVRDAVMMNHDEHDQSRSG